MNETAAFVPIADDGTRLAAILIREGTPSSVEIPIPDVLRAVLAAGCTSFELRHTHPSGSLRPSQADMDLTSHYLKAATWLGMVLVDHVIEGPSGELSMVDAGYLQSAAIPLTMAAHKEVKA